MALHDLMTRIRHGSTPIVAKGTEQALVTAATLAASGAYTASGLVDLEEARTCTLLLEYAPGAVGGFAYAIPLVSALETAPAITADSWYALPAWDGSVSSAVLAGAFPSNVDITKQPEWGIPQYRHMAIKIGDAGDATTDRYRLVAPLDVAPFRHLAILYAEVGVTATPGTFAANYVLAT